MAVNSPEGGVESSDSDVAINIPAGTTASDQSESTDKQSNGGSGSDQSGLADKSSKGVIKCGQRCEIKALEERYDDKGELETIERGSYEPGSSIPFAEFALVVKQSFHKNGILRTATVQVNSPQMLLILQEVVRAYPTQPAGFEVPITEEAPYALFYHCRDDIARYEPKDDLFKTHHDLLVKFIDAELTPAMAETAQLTSKGFITYSLLWTIFKPGVLLYGTTQGHPRLYKLVTTAYKETEEVGPWFEVHCTFTDYDGTNVGKAKQVIKLSERTMFTGRSPLEITSLRVFPRKFVNDDELEERLICRGNRLLGLEGVQVMYYEGLLEYLKLPPYSWWGPVCERDGVWTPITVAGRVVVDRKTFDEDFADETEHLSLVSEAQLAYLKSTGASPEDLDNANPLLCPPFALGYSLDRKLWCRLFIDQLSPIQWQANPMDSLILPPAQKKVLRALVGSHVFPTEARDEMNLKGKGLVILLHGTPGSGKTMTAEVGAEYTKKALLKVSLSELEDDRGLEENMRKFQRYATTWKAIVLIDEADIFLEARSSGGKEQAERNSLVAVFLRTLEYFQGIIFLTSNRVGVFDMAIKSRIHLALEYSAPSLPIRRVLWQKRLLAIPPKHRDLDVEKVLDEVEKPEMNGREISNSLHTALTLARDEESKLEYAHLETIIQLWKEFGKQLESAEASGKSTMAS